MENHQNFAGEANACDHAGSRIDACLGPSCFPALGQTFHKLQEVARYTNPVAPANRLIILSDSFGQFIAGWYPRYFREVLHFSTNTLAQLDAEETRIFRDYLFEQAKNSQFLILYHDGSTLWNRPEQDHAKLFDQH